MQQEQTRPLRETARLTIALAKGRLQDDALSLLARGGVRVRDEDLASRRLSLTDDSGRYRFVLVKPSDVPVYVERGSADCGIVGHDVITESGADVFLKLLFRGVLADTSRRYQRPCKTSVCCGGNPDWLVAGTDAGTSLGIVAPSCHKGRRECGVR